MGILVFGIGAIIIKQPVAKAHLGLLLHQEGTIAAEPRQLGGAGYRNPEPPGPKFF